MPARDLCPRGVYVVTAKLPERDGVFEYRVRSASEEHEAVGFSSGKFTPLEVAQATLARAEQVQERFNAFSLIDVDAALAMAKESTTRWRSGTPLSSVDGVPTTIKDIVWVKDRAVRYGSRTTSTTPCTQDAPSVKRLRAAGAVLIGLTTTPEFGWKAITDSPLTGVTRNPW